MAKYKIIPVDLYKRDITVFIGNHEEFKEWISQYKLPTSWEQLVESIIESDDSAIASYWYNDIGEGIIELPWHPKSSTETSIAAHESLHATFRLLDNIGVEYIINSSNESFTYLHEYILEKVLNYDDYKLINI